MRSRRIRSPRDTAVRLAAFWLVAPLAVFLHCSSPTPSDVLPELDLAAVEQQVAAKIQELLVDVEANVRSSQAWGELGMTLDIHDFKGGAIPCYRQAATLDAEEFRWPYYLAIILNEAGSKEALGEFARAMALRPDYSPAYVRYARALHDADDLDKALLTFEKAAELDDRSPHAYFGLAKIMLSRSELEASREHLLTALEIEPQYQDAHGVLAGVLRRLGQPEEAARHLDIVQSITLNTPLTDPVFDELVGKGLSSYWYRERGFAHLATGRVEEAILQFRTALQLNPDPEGHNYIGNLLQRLGRFDEAIGQYRRAIQLESNNYAAIDKLGQALLESGRVDEAVLWAEQALRIHPEAPGAYLNLGTFYMRTARDAEAIATFQRGLEQTPSSPAIAMRLAWLLATSPDAELRNGRQAIELAKSACEESDFKDPEALDVLAAAYAETGQYEKAVNTARDALDKAAAMNEQERADIEYRLKDFQSRRPYRLGR